MTEEAVYEQVARHLQRYHPDLNYHFDLSGMYTPSHTARNLYERLNRRDWPALLILEPRFMPNTILIYHGLALEIKRPGTLLRTKAGKWYSDHIAEQAAQLGRLQDQGYVAQFVVGLDQSLETIHSYLGEACDEVTEGF